MRLGWGVEPAVCKVIFRVIKYSLLLDTAFDRATLLKRCT